MTLGRLDLRRGRNHTSRLARHPASRMATIHPRQDQGHIRVEVKCQVCAQVFQSLVTCPCRAATVRCAAPGPLQQFCKATRRQPCQSGPVHTLAFSRRQRRDPRKPSAARALPPTVSRRRLAHRARRVAALTDSWQACLPRLQLSSGSCKGDKLDRLANTDPHYYFGSIAILLGV